jgi:hypothetical protein
MTIYSNYMIITQLYYIMLSLETNDLSLRILTSVSLHYITTIKTPHNALFKGNPLMFSYLSPTFNYLKPLENAASWAGTCSRYIIDSQGFPSKTLHFIGFSFSDFFPFIMLLEGPEHVVDTL